MITSEDMDLRHKSLIRSIRYSRKTTKAVRALWKALPCALGSFLRIFPCYARPAACTRCKASSRVYVYHLGVACCDQYWLD